MFRFLCSEAPGHVWTKCMGGAVALTRVVLGSPHHQRGDESSCVTEGMREPWQVVDKACTW